MTEAGAVAFLPKTAPADRMLATIRACVGQKQP